MAKYAVVVPYAYKPYFDDFMNTIKLPRENMLLIDNTNLATNLGIMRSHNMGIDFMNSRYADWLIVMSAAVRFGEPGGLDFIDILDAHPECHVINGAGLVTINGEVQNIGVGWHLTAFSKVLLDTIGRWDENLTPYGFDDIDMMLRMRKAFGDNLKVETHDVDCSHASVSHTIQLAGIDAPPQPRMLYFCEKWGRHPGAWQWDGWEHPFNNPEHDIKYWPPAPNGGTWDERIASK